MTSAQGEQQSRAPLTRERILAAAVQLVDDEGVEALTMRRLGAALGVEAMSIYNHVPSKAALLDGVVEAVIAEIDIPPRDSDWYERAKQLMRSYRAVTQRHPNVAVLLATRPYANVPAMRQVEASLEVLVDAGLKGRRVVDAFRSIAAWILGFTLSEATAATLSGPEGMAEFAVTPADFSSEEFPLVIEFGPDFIATSADEHFEYGLEVVLGGLRALVTDK